MSLLKDFSSDQAKNIARIVFEDHFKHDPKLKEEMSERRQIAMYQDILYNLSYLEIALTFQDELIFQDYAIWIYELLCHLMPDLSRERIATQMVDHYTILSRVIFDYMDPKKANQMSAYLTLASQKTKEAIDFPEHVPTFVQGEFKAIQQQYLDCLLQNDTRGAIRTILEAVQAGTSIQNIYLHVFKDVMYEVGRLWHRNLITVDKEHYCTSVTQMAIAQFYSSIFSQPRVHRKVLTSCVGSELHEMGIRMISDIFEYHGWDSMYLGASIPLKDMLHAIQEYQPELVCLSVTMPHHLEICQQIIVGIKAQFPDMKIAIGGQAFTRSQNPIATWEVDYSGNHVEDLILWANNNPKRIS